MCVIPEAVIQNILMPSLRDASYREWEYFSSLRCDVVVRRHIPEYFNFQQQFFLFL